LIQFALLTGAALWGAAPFILGSRSMFRLIVFDRKMIVNDRLWLFMTEKWGIMTVRFNMYFSRSGKEGAIANA
jgi:hypothetical protein